jgi:hypothetical protein
VKFFDEEVDWAPLTDFDFCTEVDRFDFVLRLRTGSPDHLLDGPGGGGGPPGDYARAPITKKTKLGLGIYGLHAGDNALASLTDVKPGVIVLQDPEFNFARRVRYLFPNALIIGRVYLAEQPLDAPEQRGAELADQVARLAVPYKGLVDAWMGYNEPVAHGDYVGYTAYNRLQVAFAKRLQNYYGIAAVAGNDAPGAIEPADYPKYFGEAIRECQYFGIHAYGQPGDTSFRVDDAEYYALRYRLIQAELLKAGINDTRMVLTEVGLAEGWRYRVTDQHMAEEFMWLADQTEKDPYVEGIAIFGAFVNRGWEHFNIAESRIPYILGTYQPRR